MPDLHHLRQIAEREFPDLVRSTAIFRMGETSHFIGEEIEVRFAEKPGPPTSFVCHGRKYEIVEIEKAYRRLDFKRAWWRRRHRDYYRVKTDTGQVFEIYFHRGLGKRYGCCIRSLSPR